ncbi:MAG: bifunctional glycosyltransferase family 2/GtrA family protein [Clostridiales bacterium]|nr:bifunctional glycosyltransferase family 2/GtrA family protein [Clostridiales bacterium]
MLKQTASDIAVLIPGYQPRKRLESYMEQLIGAGIKRIVVVDDGSGPDYDDIFGGLEPYREAVLLRYEKNRGKGFALRHGMEYIAKKFPDCRFVITADIDGQHTVKDILRMADALRQDSTGILLGSRDFTASHVPFKSRAGNQITSKVFQGLYGRKISDTQTGLRGFASAMIPQLLSIKGDRYEYEMNQLIYCSVEHIPLRSLPIETVYEDNNADSHFRAVADSWRIYRIILARFVHFMLSSMFCFLVDYGIYLLLNHLMKTYVPALDQYLSIFFVRFVARIGIAAAVARVASATVNYMINRRMVFFSRAAFMKSFLRYAATVVLIIALSSGLVSSLYIGLGWSDTLTKIPVDLVLFFLSYYIQRKWVFGVGSHMGAQAEELNG